MLTRQELLSNRELLIDKTRGALCGLAIGDSFGDAARTPDNQRDYGFITDFHKGDSWSTDDTEFALMVAKTIIEAGGDFTSQDVVNASSLRPLQPLSPERRSCHAQRPHRHLLRR